MSHKTTIFEGNEAKHSGTTAPPLVDLDTDEISASAPNNASFAMTHVDEMFDIHNGNTTKSSASIDLMPNENDTDEQQSKGRIDDSNSTTASTSPAQQSVNDSDKEKNTTTSVKEDSTDDAPATSAKLETSNDDHPNSPNGLLEAAKPNGDEIDENQIHAPEDDANMNNDTLPEAAIDDSTSSSIENGTNEQGLADTIIQHQGDPIDFDFDFDNSDNSNDHDGFGTSVDDNNNFNFNNNNTEDDDDDFNDFGQGNEDDDDDFGDFGDFGQAGDLGADGDDDDFGDFGDLPEPALAKDDTLSTTPPKNGLSDSIATTPTEPTLADQYIQVLQTDDSNIVSFIENTLSHLWTDVEEPKDGLVSSPASLNGTPASSPQRNDYDNDELLCTQCSLELWQKVSRDSVFYNPITGSIGQFQWTRSEINRAYLNALGVRINYEDRIQDSRPTSMNVSPSLQHRHYRQGVQPSSSSYGSSANVSTASSPSMSRINDRSPNHMRSSSLTDGISLTSAAAVAALHNGVIPDSSKPPVEEEPELDIDIAKAYCELTEETIRVFPDVKLNAMVVELSRLQRQAKEYLGYLLDQREQLMMDAETYNDLISCIVGHAQRLREQNVAKDASPAMVSKKKKTTALSGMIKRKNTTGGGTGGTSMGGGVVGVKQSSTSTGSKSTNAGEGRRSL